MSVVHLRRRDTHRRAWLHYPACGAPTLVIREPRPGEKVDVTFRDGEGVLDEATTTKNRGRVTCPDCLEDEP